MSEKLMQSIVIMQEKWGKQDATARMTIGRGLVYQSGFVFEVFQNLIEMIIFDKEV